MSTFDGATFSEAHDGARLGRQLDRVKGLMLDQQWRTHAEIAQSTGAPEASISARLRDLRKTKFGGYTVERRSRGDRKTGLFEYRVLPQVVDIFAGVDEPKAVKRPSKSVLQAAVPYLKGRCHQTDDASVHKVLEWLDYISRDSD